MVTSYKALTLTLPAESVAAENRVCPVDNSAQIICFCAQLAAGGSRTSMAVWLRHRFGR